MDLSYGKEYEDFREEVKSFLEGWPLTGDEAKLSRVEQANLFRNRAIERGYVYRHIPVEYGGSGQPADPLKDSIIREEFARVGAPGNMSNQAAGMLAPTLAEVGSEEQKRRYIPPALAGEEIWCQGYSEPGAGSDLASLQSRAELDGDEWVINGHKIWTSSAQEAHMMFGLFRTEPEASKHAGISYLLIPMNAPGIEIRPLVEITGGALFNEVRLTDVRIPAGNIVGKRGEGWAISKVTLKYERNMIGAPGQMQSMFFQLVELARAAKRNGRPAIEDEAVRQRLAELRGLLQCSETMSLRMLSAGAKGDHMSVALPMMMMKLFGTDLRAKLGELAFDLVGDDALIAPKEHESMMSADEATPGLWVNRYLGAIGIAIAGGASNIQRNVIGERGLGLPRDLRVQK